MKTRRKNKFDLRTEIVGDAEEQDIPWQAVIVKGAMRRLKKKYEWMSRAGKRKINDMDGTEE